MTANCERCGDELSEPVELFANYVTNEDIRGPKLVDVTVAIIPSEESLEAADEISNHYPNTSKETILQVMAGDTETANYLGRPADTTKDEIRGLDVGDDSFESVRIANRSEAPPETILTTTQQDIHSVQKTGLVCKTCVKDTDEVIW